MKGWGFRVGVEGGSGVAGMEEGASGGKCLAPPFVPGTQAGFDMPWHGMGRRRGRC